MKKYILLLTLGLITICTVQAQKTNGTIHITDIKIEETGDNMTVSFQADAPRRMIGSHYTMVYSPVLTDGSFMVSLPPVIVQGRTAANIRKRQELATGENYYYDNAVYTRPGESLTYTATTPTQRWMDGARLQLESVLFGCCSALDRDTKSLAQNIRIITGTTEYETVVPEVTEDVFVPQTLADTLMLSFPFVAEASEFDPQQPFKIYDDERDNALIVYFAQGKSTISPNFRDNKQTLTNLTSVVSMILNDRASEVEKVVIGGFASPEGGYEQNDRLAFERAVAVKEHIVHTTGIPDGLVLVFNGSVDWRGLRHMVSGSNLPDRRRIIDLIDNTPVWEQQGRKGRLAALKELNGGTTYRRLFEDYFPLMRNGAFIKVYYKNK